MNTNGTNNFAANDMVWTSGTITQTPATTANYCGNTYTYPYTYYTWPTDQTARIATLEGEVKVLREMVAALRDAHAPRTRKAKARP